MSEEHIPCEIEPVDLTPKSIVINLDYFTNEQHNVKFKDVIFHFGEDGQIIIPREQLISILQGLLKKEENCS